MKDLTTITTNRKQGQRPANRQITPANKTPESHLTTITTNETGHISVLKDEVLQFLQLRNAANGGGNFLDMTFGGGGHTRALLAADSANKVTSVDCDPEAAPRADALKKEFGSRFTFVDSFFDEVEGKVPPTARYDGILFDLGVSSYQLDTPQRGFSFRTQAIADMRMNPRVGIPAWQLLEEATPAQLEVIVRDYAEELKWKAIVRELMAAKGTGALRTTESLSQLIAKHVYINPKKRGRLHPATRVFMGLRMAVNDEAERLERALRWAYSRLNASGVLAVISFHSIEDRIAKMYFRELTRPKETAQAQLLLKKVGRPQADETDTNIRARSAKLRVIQKNATNTPTPRNKYKNKL